MGSDVGSGNLERGASSNLGGEGTGADTATSTPSSSAVVRAFHALKEKCSLKIEVFSKFKDRFQFPEETRARLPRKDEKACAFAHGEGCFYEAVFMWPQVPRPSLHYETSSSSKPCTEATYAQFMENCHKLYGHLDDHF